MRARSLLFSVLVCLFVEAVALADAVYRVDTTMRLFGNNQGLSGSCEAEADIGALESAFAAQNMHVRLSTFYRHAFNWKDAVWKADGSDAALKKMVNLALTPADVALLNQAGAIVPDYMWPEDNFGLDWTKVGTLPTPTQMAILDSRFPKAEALGFNKLRYWFDARQPAGTLDALKAAVKAGKAVTLSVHGEMFNSGSFDHRTGLVTGPLAIDQMSRGITHSVSVLGFDDSLYADPKYKLPYPGALIIRNSWNDKRAFDASMKFVAKDEQLLADLAAFRLKIAPTNLPGYYAVPYAYVNDLIARKVDGARFSVLELNFGAYFAAYQQFAALYETKVAPFVCDSAIATPDNMTPPRRTGDGMRDAIRTLGDNVQIMNNCSKYSAITCDAAKRAVYSMLVGHTSHASLAESSIRRFQYAKLPHHKEYPQTDRVKQFYDGAYVSYYCGAYISGAVFKDHKIFPGSDVLSRTGISQGLRILSTNTGSMWGWLVFLEGLL